MITNISLQHKRKSYVSVSISNKYPTRSNITQFILSGNCSTCFGWCHHPTSGVQTIVSTASGICHTITATCHYIATGSSNGVTNTRRYIVVGSSNGVTNTRCYIVAGSSNSVTNTRCYIVAGSSNGVTNTRCYIVAGSSNGVTNTRCYIVAGSSNGVTNTRCYIVAGSSNSVTNTRCYIVAGSSNGVTNTRRCRYSCLRSWWWVVVPPETCRAVSRQNKLCNIAPYWIYIKIFLRCMDPWTLKTLNVNISLQPSNRSPLCHC